MCLVARRCGVLTGNLRPNSLAGIDPGPLSANFEDRDPDNIGTDQWFAETVGVPFITGPITVAGAKQEHQVRGDHDRCN